MNNTAILIPSLPKYNSKIAANHAEIISENKKLHIFILTEFLCEDHKKSLEKYLNHFEDDLDRVHVYEMSDLDKKEYSEFFNKIKDYIGNSTVHHFPFIFKLKKLFQILESFELDNNFKFEYFLRVRFDIFIRESYKFLLEKLDDNTVFGRPWMNCMSKRRPLGILANMPDNFLSVPSEYTLNYKSWIKDLEVNKNARVILNVIFFDHSFGDYMEEFLSKNPKCAEGNYNSPINQILIDEIKNYMKDVDYEITIKPFKNPAQKYKDGKFSISRFQCTDGSLRIKNFLTPILGSTLESNYYISCYQNNINFDFTPQAACFNWVNNYKWLIIKSPEEIDKNIERHFYADTGIKTKQYGKHCLGFRYETESELQNIIKSFFNLKHYKNLKIEKVDFQQSTIGTAI